MNGVNNEVAAAVVPRAFVLFIAAFLSVVTTKPSNWTAVFFVLWLSGLTGIARSVSWSCRSGLLTAVIRGPTMCCAAGAFRESVNERCLKG
jgi:hypothetical protein